MTYLRLLALIVSLGASLSLCPQSLLAATNVPIIPRAGFRTNAVPKLPGGLTRTNPGTGSAVSKPATNAPAAASSTNTTSRLVQTFRQWQSSPTFYPVEPFFRYGRDEIVIIEYRRRRFVQAGLECKYFHQDGPGQVSKLRRVRRL